MFCRLPVIGKVDKYNATNMTDGRYTTHPMDEIASSNIAILTKCLESLQKHLFGVLQNSN